MKHLNKQEKCLSDFIMEECNHWLTNKTHTSTEFTIRIPPKRWIGKASLNTIFTNLAFPIASYLIYQLDQTYFVDIEVDEKGLHAT